MADTTTLEKLNTEIVQLVDQLSSMQAKQERLRELVRQRSELEQELLGISAEVAPKGPGRKRMNNVPAAVAAD
jgi:hypothetical protein